VSSERTQSMNPAVIRPGLLTAHRSPLTHMGSK
jgi:hypothetical protein